MRSAPALAAMAAAVTLGGASSAGAQTDFSGLKVRLGDVVYVTDSGGVQVSGRLTHLSNTTIAIDGYQFSPQTSLRIERDGDPIWDGALIGFGIGMVMGTTVGAESCLHQPQWHCAVEGGIMYGAIGAFIDWLHVGRTVIFQAPDTRSKAARLMPLLTTRSKGLALRVAF
jgi:hypothetical protein